VVSQKLKQDVKLVQTSFNDFLYKIYDLMSVGAELGQYFLCKHATPKIMKIQEGSLKPP